MKVIEEMMLFAKDFNLEELGKVMRKNGVVRLTIKRASGDELNFYCEKAKQDWQNAIKKPKATRMNHTKSEPYFETTTNLAR